MERSGWTDCVADQRVLHAGLLQVSEGSLDPLSMVPIGHCKFFVARPLRIAWPCDQLRRGNRGEILEGVVEFSPP